MAWSTDRAVVAGYLAMGAVGTGPLSPQTDAYRFWQTTYDNAVAAHARGGADGQAADTIMSAMALEAAAGMTEPGTWVDAARTMNARARDLFSSGVSFVALVALVLLVVWRYGRGAK